MKLIVGNIDPRHVRIIEAMATRTDELLRKTASVASKEKPLVVMETRPVVYYGCR